VQFKGGSVQQTGKKIFGFICRQNNPKLGQISPSFNASLQHQLPFHNRLNYYLVFAQDCHHFQHLKPTNIIMVNLSLQSACNYYNMHDNWHPKMLNNKV
jgi:hypothetical protein